MLRPSSSTRPSTRAVATVSCKRLRQRRNVDLPQPDGPMMAVTCLSCRSMLAPRTADDGPKYALRSSTRMRGQAEPVPLVAMAAASGPARGEPRQDADEEHDRDEHQRAGPRHRV